jgi:hypothetical protein
MQLPGFRVACDRIPLVSGVLLFGPSKNIKTEFWAIWRRAGGGHGFVGGGGAPALSRPPTELSYAYGDLGVTRGLWQAGLGGGRIVLTYLYSM